MLCPGLSAEVATQSCPLKTRLALFPLYADALHTNDVIRYNGVLGIWHSWEVQDGKLGQQVGAVCKPVLLDKSTDRPAYFALC